MSILVTPMRSSLLSFVLLAACPVMAETGAAKAAAKPSAESKSDTANASGEEPAEGPKSEPRVAAVSSIEPGELSDFEHYAPQVRQLVRDALALTRLNLTYTFGSSNPKQGGMDCSGAIYHLLKEHGFKDVPRQSDEMCGWVRKQTLLHRVQDAGSLKHPEFAALQPGDLLFWSGTYETSPRTIPVTHVMLYLGKLKKTGKPVMFGASDGRVYQAERRTGVSVFDFTLPKEAGKSKFYGYGMIPGVGRIVPKVAEPPVLAKAPEPAPAKPASAAETPKPAPEPKVAAAKTATPKATPTKATPPEVAETIKKAIVLTDSEPEAKTTPAAKSAATTSTKSSTATASKPKATSSTTAKKSGGSSSDSTKKKATTASRSRAQPRTPPPATIETKIRQKAREVGDSLKNAFTR